MTENQAASKLDVFGDFKAREVLATLNVRPSSVKELDEQLDMSVPTIYRRLDRLEEHDLITKRSIVSPDGNHYYVYDSNFKTAVITLQGDEYDVSVFRDDLFADKFTELWSVIRRAGDG